MNLNQNHISTITDAIIFTSRVTKSQPPGGTTDDILIIYIAHLHQLSSYVVMLIPLNLFAESMQTHFNREGVNPLEENVDRCWRIHTSGIVSPMRTFSILDNPSVSPGFIITSREFAMDEIVDPVPADIALLVAKKMKKKMKKKSNVHSNIQNTLSRMKRNQMICNRKKLNQRMKSMKSMKKNKKTNNTKNSCLSKNIKKKSKEQEEYEEEPDYYSRRTPLHAEGFSYLAQKIQESGSSSNRTERTSATKDDDDDADHKGLTAVAEQGRLVLLTAEGSSTVQSLGSQAEGSSVDTPRRSGRRRTRRRVN
ncbi:hypothetical protein EDC96DRAFT_549774 [Choanephora cucurbitarum]|nr:hypothetical protein EDC96DRAFT_549774 [Choanephora cucurbitarum]